MLQESQLPGMATWRRVRDYRVWALSQMGNVLAIRSESDSLFRLGLFSNPHLLGAVALTFALQLATIYAPPFQKLFRTEALSLTDLGYCLAFSCVVFVGVEMKKLIQNLVGPRNAAV